MKSISLCFIRDKRQHASKPVVDEQHFTFLYDYDWMTVKKRKPKKKVSKNKFPKPVQQHSPVLTNWFKFQTFGFKIQLKLHILKKSSKTKRQIT